MSSPLNSHAELDSKLVDLVRANPLLYEREVRSSPYVSMKRKTELWKSIATSLGVEAKYCITRWKNLRDKFRRELEKAHEMQRKAGGAKTAKGSTWHLLEKMRFLESHIKHYGLHNTKSSARQTTASWNEMDAEQLIEQITNEDDPLQEAMEEQSIAEHKEVTGTVITTSNANPESCVPVGAVNLKRIETLLEGLDPQNRSKAEKRIVAYLCKCQLKSLNNESVDDVVV